MTLLLSLSEMNCKCGISAGCTGTNEVRRATEKLLSHLWQIRLHYYMGVPVPLGQPGHGVSRVAALLLSPKHEQ